MPILNPRELLESVARKSSGETESGRAAPASMHSLDEAHDALTGLAQAAQAQPLTRPMRQNLVAVTRASNINTDRAVARFLDAHPAIAARSLPAATLRNLGDLDSALSSVNYAAQLTSAGFLQVEADENALIDQAHDAVAALAGRTDLLSPFAAGFTVGEAQLLLADAIARYQAAIA